MTPVALAGPGVSSPTAFTRSRGIPVRCSKAAKVRSSASRATSGPSVTRLGLSISSATRKRPAVSSTVALFLLPPLSSPTTTQASPAAGIASARERGRGGGALELLAAGLVERGHGLAAPGDLERREVLAVERVHADVDHHDAAAEARLDAAVARHGVTDHAAARPDPREHALERRQVRRLVLARQAAEPERPVVARRERRLRVLARLHDVARHLALDGRVDRLAAERRRLGGEPAV